MGDSSSRQVLPSRECEVRMLIENATSYTFSGASSQSWSSDGADKSYKAGLADEVAECQPTRRGRPKIPREGRSSRSGRSRGKTRGVVYTEIERTLCPLNIFKFNPVPMPERYASRQ